MKLDRGLWGRSLRSGMFGVSIILVVLLEFTVICYGNSHGREYSVFEILFVENYRELLRNEGISFYQLWNRTVGPYVAMFMPVIVIFPFINVFWTDRNSGYSLFIINRIGKKKYYLMQMTEAWVSSGLTVLFGTWIFHVLLYVLFPGPEEAISLGQDILFQIKNSVAVFLYGMVMGTPALFFSSILKNRYVVCCVPFMCVYLYDLAVGNSPVLSSSSLLYIWDGVNTVEILVGHIAAGILFSVLFYTIMMGRGKHGEY